MFRFDESIEPEYTGEHLGHKVELSKVGGGTLGREYVGWWQFKIALSSGKVETNMFETTTLYSHQRAALLIAACYGWDEE